MPNEGPSFYDNAPVFDAYMEHRRTRGNPNDTMEKPVVDELIGDVSGKSCLDLGCGDARFGAELLERGATRFVGVEGSSRMLAAARLNLTDPRAQLIHADLRSWTCPADKFDLVVSRLALHYLEDVSALLTTVFKSLTSGGKFVLSVEHPNITSCDRAWRGEGLRQDWIVDDYFDTGRRTTKWLGSEVVKFHRTTEDWFRGLQEAGFAVQALREARPERLNFDDAATWERRKRIPLFLILAAQRMP